MNKEEPGSIFLTIRFTYMMQAAAALFSGACAYLMIKSWYAESYFFTALDFILLLLNAFSFISQANMRRRFREWV